MIAKIAIIHTNDGSDVRVGKLCRSACRLGFNCHYIGWDRRPSECKSSDLGGAKRHIMVRASRRGRATISGTLLFYFHVVAVLARIRPDTVLVVNEDLAFLLLPFRRLIYRRLICDVFDSLVDRHSNKNAIYRAIAAILSAVSRWGADQLFATDDRRRKRFGKHIGKTSVIENFPEDPGDKLSQQIPSGAVKIYVAGSLSEGRGLRQILSAAERLSNVSIISAGWIYDDYASIEFRQHPMVDYRGIVDSRQSLCHAAECDAVLAFYSPCTTNNIYASPNKIYDALSVGRMSIVNTETKVSEWIRHQNLGFVCPYNDVAGLVQVLLALSDRSEFAENSARLRAKFLKRFQWRQFEPVLKKAFIISDH